MATINLPICQTDKYLNYFCIQMEICQIHKGCNKERFSVTRILSSQLVDVTLAGSTYLNYIDNSTFVGSVRQRHTFNYLLKQSTSFHFHSFIYASKSQFNLLLYPRRTFASVKIEFLTFYVVSHKIVSLMPMPHCLANNK